MDFGFPEVLAITIICYMIGSLVKHTEKINDKFIPDIVGISGAIIGVIAYLTKLPDFPADHIITAIAVGATSGLAATGVNQIFKQHSKED